MDRKSSEKLADDYRRQRLHDPTHDQVTRDKIDYLLLLHQTPQSEGGKVARLQLIKYLETVQD